ncbi:DUF6951 family protein [Desulfitobacterium sp.]|uniref:DUF6951 family protein n=1 Tax=Desulfitobacterium sp. TaxID=49981 RepID=UPI002BF02229|nr:hypothetical protein [Desulfitobacterium sp.]HVJ47821.1 hypothetical protein [Desulfitobacterium sp.]
MATVKVNAGVCGFHTLIKVSPKDAQNVLINMETECPNLKPMAEELHEASTYGECFAVIGESAVFELARKYCKHPACPVPLGIIKGIEVAGKLALPRKVEIEVEKD